MRNTNPKSAMLGSGQQLYLGSYILLSRLASGGMAEVFLARSAAGHLVAIKRPLPRLLNNPEALARFEREVEIHRKLEHRHIARFLDAGRQGDCPFLVLEHLPDPDLYSLVREGGKLPFPTASKYARQVLAALEHVHAAGVVHRDVQPANVKLHKGETKLLDFGLAGFLGTETKTPLTRFGDTLGAVEFSAPEQIFNPELAGPRADIYGVGATLYFLLTGQLPRRQKAQWLSAGLPDDFPPEPEKILKKMTASRPEDRYATAGKAAAALRDVKAQSEKWAGPASSLVKSLARTAATDAVAKTTREIEPPQDGSLQTMSFWSVFRFLLSWRWIVSTPSYVKSVLDRARNLSDRQRRWISVIAMVLIAIVVFLLGAGIVAAMQKGKPRLEPLPTSHSSAKPVTKIEDSDGEHSAKKTGSQWEVTEKIRENDWLLEVTLTRLDKDEVKVFIRPGAAAKGMVVQITIKPRDGKETSREFPLPLELDFKAASWTLGRGIVTVKIPRLIVPVPFQL